jgi:hypothetical protein
MSLSDDDIKKALGGIESAPPSTSTSNAAIRVVTDALPFTPTAPQPWEAFAKLDDMSLPPKIRDRAIKAFENAGFVVETATAVAQHNKKKLRPYTAAIRNDDGVRLALVHVPAQLFEEPDVWGSFGAAVYNVEGLVRFVAEGNADSTPGFIGYLKTLQGREKDWRFISWNFFSRFLDGQDPAELVFEFTVGGPAPNDLALSTGHRTTVQDALAFLANNHGAGKKEFFENLDGAGWPEAFRQSLNGAWTGNPQNDSGSLFQ